MENKNLFEQLNVKIKNNFFEDSFCNLILEKMQKAEKKLALVNKGSYMPNFRNTFSLKMPESIHQQVIQRVREKLQPELEEFL